MKNAPRIPCTSCEDYWCTLHAMHAHDCPCPPIEEWEQSPYVQLSRFAITQKETPCDPSDSTEPITS